MLRPVQFHRGDGDIVTDPLGRAQQACGPLVAAEFGRHPGQSFECDGQTDPVVDRVLARNWGVGQRFAPFVMLPDPVEGDQIGAFLAPYGITLDEIVSRMGGTT